MKIPSIQNNKEPVAKRILAAFCSATASSRRGKSTVGVDCDNLTPTDCSSCLLDTYLITDDSAIEKLEILLEHLKTKE